jgi:hypothetical protein
MECFGGGIRHTLSRKCIEDEHHGAQDHYSEVDKHKRTCAWVLYERQARCDCSPASGRGVENE